MNNTEAFYLIDILNLINYNIDSMAMLKEKKSLLIKHYKNAIITIIKTLERKKQFEYLYICILLITSRICEDIVKNYLTKPEDIPGSSKSVSDKYNQRYFKRHFPVNIYLIRLLIIYKQIQFFLCSQINGPKVIQ